MEVFINGKKTKCSSWINDVDMLEKFQLAIVNFQKQFYHLCVEHLGVNQWFFGAIKYLNMFMESNWCNIVR